MARQRITHGAVIDAATTDEVAAMISQVITGQQRDEEFHPEKGSVKLDGTGAGIVEIKTTRQYGWLCERVTFTANPAAGALIQLFENNQAGSDMREVVQLGALGLYSDGFANKMYIPPGSKIIVAVTGGPANGELLFNIQTKLIRAANG